MSTTDESTKKGKRLNANEVYARLKQMITSFELYPGSRVTEHELADLFSISRTPIRQALQRLEIEGFLTVRPKQGCFIRALDVAELAEYYDVRIAVEQLVIEYAVNNMTDKQIEQFIAMWQPEMHDIDLAEGIDLGEKDEAFHVGLAQASGKPVIAEVLVNINNRIRIIRRLDLNTDNRSVRTYQEHSEILEHILNRDTAKAKNMMKRHIMRSREFAKTLTLTALARQKSFAVSYSKKS
ncbi:MAG TPA: GntR family transcriptional regulator [Methylophilaceae bacterium]|nr:GntR family transcriptional regulator [Methylophilaceae bacterium]HAJ71652.1 GntR family transcriptional regulator [Methylophilaceae bacterium]